MSYQLNFVANFRIIGLTLNAKLYDGVGAQVGSTITSGFVAFGNGAYGYIATIPDGHVGTLIIYNSADNTQFVPFSINPDEQNASASIWSYGGQRTLTNVVPGASLVATIAGNMLTLIRAVSFDVTLTGLSIPANWAKIYFTVKTNVSSPDNQSLIQIVASNPAAPGSDGLLYLQGGTTPSLSYGSLVVDQPGGNVAVSITDDATVTVQPNTYSYDLKVITSASKSGVLAGGLFNVTATPTLTV